jgi:hypothetical protein
VGTHAGLFRECIVLTRSLTIAFLLASTAARADILLPPERFDHPCNIKPVEFLLSEVRDICDGADKMACTFMNAPGGPLMVLPVIGPGGVAPRTRMLLLRHECGHVNGWTAKHEDAR